MTNEEKKAILQKLKSSNTTSEEAYYETLCIIGDEKTDYYLYMITAPIDCNEELKRLPDADYDLCCALLTMLLREDHFNNGSFVERYNNGQVQPILERMIELLD